MRWIAINIYRLRASLLALVLAAAVAAGLLALVGTAKPAEAAFPGANGKIAFASNRVTTENPTGDSEIFAMNPDGTGIEQLTFNTVLDVDPAWSADGSWIAYSSEQQAGNQEIYMRSYGVGDFVQTLRLTKNTAFDGRPVFSPDGTKMAFTSDRDANQEIYVMDTADTDGDENGDHQTNLTNNAATDRNPAFSPDGTKIAFESDRDANQEIYVMNADGSGTPTRLTNNSAVDGTPAWSPDGSKIAFLSVRDGNVDIYVMNADGSERKRLTKKAAADYDPAWSPDGKRIAFESYRGGGVAAEIFVMKAKSEGRKNRPKNLTRNEVSDFGPDWQPLVS